MQLTGRLSGRSTTRPQFGERQSLPGGRRRVNGTENVIVPVGKGQGAPVPLFGYTGSPTLHGELLITPVGGQAGRHDRGLSIRTRGGWSGRRSSENVSYSSPVVAEIGGRSSRWLSMTGPRVVGLAARGRCAAVESSVSEFNTTRASARPAIAGDMVLVTATGRPLTALRISRDGDKCQKQVAWTSEILSSYLSSMVTSGEHVYGMNDGGEFSCLRLSDGKILWTGGNHGYYSSPIVAGKRLFALNEQGQLARIGQLIRPATRNSAQANSRPAKPGPCRPSSAAESMCAAPTAWRASRSSS